MKVRASVVIAAYNAEDSVGAAIRSNLDDALGVGHEVVVVDDGSSDRTREQAERVADDRVRVVSLDRNRGRAVARNTAVEYARGDLIVPCDADDRSLPGRLRAHLDAFEEHPECDVVFGKVRAHAADGSTRHWPVMPTTPDAIDTRFARGQMAVAHGASAFRRSWFETTGGYDPGIPVAEDFDLFLRGHRPGGYVQHEEFVLEYNVPTRFPAWEYWWENERYRRAIVDRHTDDPGAPIGPFLAHRSTAMRRTVERARWYAHRSLQRFR